MIISLILMLQGEKKIIFRACHLGKLKLTLTSPDVISTSPKSFSKSRIDFTVLLLFEFLKKNHLPVWAEFTSPITKSISPGQSDTTFFAHCATLIFHQGLEKKKLEFQLVLWASSSHISLA